MSRDDSRPVIFGGSVCSQCERTRNDLGIFSFSVCARCQLTYYCSEACQRAVWKDHKKVCRRPGECKPGDLADSRMHVGKIKRGDTVRIVSPVKSDNGEECWIVFSHNDESKEAIIPANGLKRVRPELWNICNSAECEAFYEAMRQAQDATGSGSTVVVGGVKIMSTVMGPWRPDWPLPLNKTKTTRHIPVHVRLGCDDRITVVHYISI